jgi:hypothetical protein
MARAVTRAGRLSLVSSSCRDVVFFSARGSGETAKSPGGLLGGPGAFLWDQLPAKLTARGLSSSAVPINRLGTTSTYYTADGVSDLYPTAAEVAGFANFATRAATTRYYLHHNYAKYNASIARGVSVTISDLEGEASRCPHTQMVVSGYSQGAIAVHDAENWLKAHNPGVLKHVVATLLVGDGDKVPHSKAVRFGTAPVAGEGLRVWFRAVHPVEVAVPSATAEIQNHRDFVGDFTLWNIAHWKTSGAVHTTYDTTTPNKTMLRSAANWAVSLTVAVTAAEFPVGPAGMFSRARGIHCAPAPSGYSLVYYAPGPQPGGGSYTGQPYPWVATSVSAAGPTSATGQCVYQSNNPSGSDIAGATYGVRVTATARPALTTPTSIPTGQTVEINGGAASCGPQGQSPEVVLGFSSGVAGNPNPAIHPTISALQVISDGTWTAQMTIPAGTPTGPWAVYADCLPQTASPDPGGWLFRYEPANFQVTP